MVYPTDIIAQAVTDTERRTVWGTWGMPKDLQRGVNLQQVSHRVKNLRIEGGWLMGDIEPMNTTVGLELQKQLERDPEAMQFRLVSFVRTHPHYSELDQPPQKVVDFCQIVAVAVVAKAPKLIPCLEVAGHDGAVTRSC